MAYNYILSLLISALVTGALYAAWRLLMWARDAALYRWTSTFELTSDNAREWGWLESFIRTSLADDAKHWIVPLYGTRPQPGDVGLPIRFQFEDKTIRLRVSQRVSSQMILREYVGPERRVASFWTRRADGEFWHRFLRMLKSEHERKVANHIQVRMPHVGRDGNLNANFPRTVAKRSFSSLTLDEALLREAPRELADFLDPAHKAFCRASGFAYRRGWLLEGPPGNGKSSFITAVASSIGAEVVILSLGSKNLDDASLRSMMEGSRDESDPPRLLVLEDVDCLFAKREAATGEVTFSGLLNALDGVGATDNAIVIMTTNHPEKLDPALIRPGRVDRRFHFADPDNARIAGHYLKFFPQESRLSEATLAFVEHCRATAAKDARACSMAHVQEEVLRAMNRDKDSHLML